MDHHRCVTLIFLVIILSNSSESQAHDDHDHNLIRKTGSIRVDLPSTTLAGPWADLLQLVNAHKGDSKSAISKLKSYFATFGYLNITSNSSTTFDDALESAVKLYQQNFRLPITGTLDSSTIAQILKPRCGGQDVDLNGISQMLQNHSHGGSSSSSHFVKHYSFFPGTPRWTSKSRLTYAFDQSNPVSTIPFQTVRAAFSRGFQRWAALVPLNFTEVSSVSSPDIVIDFASFEHGDSHPFDGQLGVLGHAFSPEDGRFHLDASENWSVDVRSDKSITAIDLESVVTHEIGHLIGLGHSGDDTAIMYPSISPRQVKLEFAQDDVDGAQALYGANPSYVPGVSVSVGTDANTRSSASPGAASQSTTIALVASLCFSLLIMFLV